MVKSKWPLIMAAIAGLAMLGVYEYALHNSPAKEQEPDYFNG